MGKQAEAGGIAKDGAKMVRAVANAEVRTCVAALLPDEEGVLRTG